MKVYTLQEDRHGNRIVCGDDRERNAYRIIASGSYAEMLAAKVAR